MNFKRLIILLFLFSSSLTKAQRTIPYPIILVHGLDGSSARWDVFSRYLKSDLDLKIEKNKLDYNLNCDGDEKKSLLKNDVCEEYLPLGNNDVYIINFEMFDGGYSNQSAIVKQGYALKLAISRVLAATGASKVMLLGHSMGGLTIREYLQNSSNWQIDGEHHVAKVITIGTPHTGSNLGSNFLNLGSWFGKNEKRDAVRDLRTTYSGGCEGVYLFGGYENSECIDFGLFGMFDNLDVNCNGKNGDYIVGLNKKNIPTDLDYACIIGGPDISDGVVYVSSQNLNNVYNNLAELFYYDCNLLSDLNICHLAQPEKAISQMVQSLDEPKNEKINLKISTLHKGFFTQQASGKNWDSDDYLLKIPQRGLLSFDMKIDGLSTPYFSIYSKSGELLYINQAYETFKDKILINKDDELSVRLYGDSRGEVLSYELVFDFCKMPPIPKIQNTGYDYFCDNQPVTLQATQGYDTYQWLFNGNQYYSSQDNIQVNRTGIFSVSGSICGINTASTNFISTTAIQSPNKPTLKKQEINDEVVLISSFPETNSWLHNGNKIYGVNSSTLIPNELGSYQVIAKKNGCSNTSDPVLLTMEKPTLNFQTNPFICNGESTTLIAPAGFKDYLFYENNNEIKSTKNELTITRPGVYSVKTKKGKFTSSASDPLIVSIVEKPLKPQITLQYQGLKASNENTTYQWFNNGKIILDSTRQYLKNTEAGIYSVRVEKNGCQTDSDPYEILSDDFPVNIYPNPSKGDFKVELPQTFSEWTLKLFNLQGKNIFTKIHENYFTNFENINIKIDKGVYLLKIITPNGTKSETIIIE